MPTQVNLRHSDRKRSLDPPELISGPPTVAVNFGLNCLEWLVGRLVDRSATALGCWWPLGAGMGSSAGDNHLCRRCRHTSRHRHPL